MSVLRRMTRAGEVLLTSWHNRGQLVESRMAREELEFLPAALEIQECPPNAAGRILTLSIAAFALIAIVWSVLGKVEIIATAEGKVVPGGLSKIIQPLEIGTVTAIRVREGQTVAAGESLVELDNTLTGADREHVTYALRAQRLEVARGRALIELLDRGSELRPADAVRAQAVVEATAAEVALQAQLLEQEWVRYRAQQDGLRSTRRAKDAERRRSREVIAQLEQTLPLVTKRGASLKVLVDRQLAAETQYLELEEQRITQQQTLTAERIRQDELAAEISAVDEELRRTDADLRTQALSRVAEAEKAAAGLAEDLEKAQSRHEHTVLRAPVDGVVQELAVSTIGGVVTPAQKLMVVVPTDDGLEVEAVLQNKDIGFVRPKATAEIKIHTFPFTQYGIVDGSVLSVSDDAVKDDKLGLVYSMRLLMKQSTLLVDGEVVRLRPGMTVTAEIRTGDRRLVEFFLAPLLRYRSESIRER